jgi:hypothetical protein
MMTPGFSTFRSTNHNIEPTSSPGDCTILALEIVTFSWL